MSERPTNYSKRTYKHFFAPEHHPLYSDENAVYVLSNLLLSHGFSVFQLFQMGDEREHSEWLLSIIDPEEKARTVLSLGCGVAGMEAFWHLKRPELKFEFVNTSKAQLDMITCPGLKFCADAETYLSQNGFFDVIVIAYLLGHVEPEATLKNAMDNLAEHGRLVIYDVFDGTERFDTELFYDSPSLRWLEQFGVEQKLWFRAVVEGYIPMGALARAEVPWVKDEVTPALFIFQK
jgi:hypothetical protein